MKTFILVALFVGLVAACDDDSSSSSGNSGGSAGQSNQGGGGTQGGPASNCAARCGAVASKCGQPASTCDSQCASLTETQLKCLEGAGCEADDLVGCLKQGGGGQGQSGSGGSAGSTSGSKAKLGEACNCAGGNFKCLDTSAGPCEGDLTCLDFSTDSGDGYCSQKCAGSGQGDCPAGYTCTIQEYNGLDIGSWCKKN